MNNKIRRTIAALCAVAAVAIPFGTAPSFTGSSNTFTASAASQTYLSGRTNYEFSYTDRFDNFTLYFNVLSSSAKTASVIGCCTRQEGTNVTIPRTATFRGVEYKITEIASTSFAYQENIDYVNITDNIKKIGDGAFIGCSEVGCFYLSDSVTEIGNYAFEDCSGMQAPWTFNLRNVKKIGTEAFKNCSGIERITAPSLVSMGAGAFRNCYRLSHVSLANSSLTEIPVSAFENCGSWIGDGEVVLPPTVKRIGNRAFYKFNNITEIDLSNVTSIGDSAFEDCHNLINVTTNLLLNYIGDFAFYGCDYMTRFNCLNPNAVIGERSIGFDHMRHYTGPKKNFTIYGLRSNSTARKYADRNGFVYVTIR